MFCSTHLRLCASIDAYEGVLAPDTQNLLLQSVQDIFVVRKDQQLRGQTGTTEKDAVRQRLN